MVRGSSKILASSTTFLTTFEEVMRSHLTVPLSPRHAGRSEAGFAISPHPSCTIIQKTGWTVKIKMGLIQIKLKFIHYFINWLHTNYNRVNGKCQGLGWLHHCTQWSTTFILENTSNANGKREVMEDTMPRTFEHLVPF